MKFMALGATDDVGASAYFVELDGVKFLLDCGRGVNAKGVFFGPDYTGLLQEGIVSDLAELDAICISHAHFDHIGSLPQLAKACPGTPIYATSLTRALGDILLWDKLALQKNEDTIQAWGRELMLEKVLARIRRVSYQKPFAVGSVQVTFWAAGHVPGAAMIYLQGQEGSLLYTGDFKREATGLTEGYHLPAGLHPDVVVLCGLHSRHPGHVAVNSLAYLEQEIRQGLRRYGKVFLGTMQLTKGLETVLLCRRACPDAVCYLDRQIWRLAARLEATGQRVLDADCSPWPENAGRGIYITKTGRGKKAANWLRADFSLHDNLADDVALLEALHPATVFVVHAPVGKNAWEDTALQRLLPDRDIIYPRTGRLYTNE